MQPISGAEPVVRQIEEFSANYFTKPQTVMAGKSQNRYIFQ